MAAAIWLNKSCTGVTKAIIGEMAERGTRANIVFGLIIALLFYVLWVVRHALLLIYVSILFAVIFTPLIQRIRNLSIWKWRPSTGVAVLILAGCLLGALAFLFLVVLPPIFQDFQTFTQELPEQLSQLSGKLQNLPFGHRLAAALNPADIARHLTDLLRRTLAAILSIASGLADILILVILIPYFIIDGRQSLDWAVSLLPVADKARLCNSLKHAGHRAQRWLTGQLLLMLILGSLTALVLGLLHVRYFYALAVFSGVANFIPVVGPIATVALASLVAALDSWFKVAGVLIFYFAYQQLENAYLSPKIMQSNVGLAPVAVIIALTIGATLAGILGALVAVPTAAIVATLADEYLVQPSSNCSK
jgi:predicted PurR-regulated permease PerM